MRTYTNKSCVRFVKDMHKAGFEVEHMRRHEALRLSQADRHEWKVCPPCYTKAKEES
jgi:hypothetical protein